MSDQYKPVRDAMAAGTPHDLICGTCLWSRPCVNPPAMTSDDITREIAEMKEKALANGAGPGQAAMVQLTGVAMYAGRDEAGVMCPVFVHRLRSPTGRQLADTIRTAMRGEPG